MNRLLIDMDKFYFLVNFSINKKLSLAFLQVFLKDICEGIAASCYYQAKELQFFVVHPLEKIWRNTSNNFLIIETFTENHFVHNY